ncbi:U11/U12 small nuclear ribonucleoprotein 48 kDa protein-like [Vicia villosa]|uniref:U11/U12 small nuclear ribonucleoprotein 48 kDa protein-like n=1 Tax=Vicia villosa TaxID=3911 RepID=UPI00273CD023|nr:U11/U12 small nuclear ribonucleoprotein 48 kDa protein-like [Vicia villosa]XP_058770638.1 U11/U12 small nuclear ribonucleoprotein 48 kDa protein-like [Vicia villosa]XP_058770639.1 U11/U12 small nuclear ribonucleoprotein 48 kDa protein-like [Vicia villosa]XP_058770640.1 U11/U12 small nuclear ribonucleoprotein 48 kDa protein-like [Vicia villosa]XP_058770641.1 U11/U12 small nuclear ribonucleoprotein 48 kDa protein-like [Vicia villosa]XP_058770642.1 U11/U12 small nuclear ribonucleoprotein 48 kD
MQHPIMNLPLPPPPPPSLPPPSSHPSLPPPSPHPSLPPPPPSPHPSLPPPPPPPRPTLNHLNTTLSSLTNLLTFSNQILSTTPKPQTLTSNLIPCLFNHNHLLPPSSLFLHHLRCPSSPRPLPDLNHLLTSLSYPKTLHNPQSTHLSSYFDFTSNFFYNNCPGVVTFSEANSVAKTATLHLPDFLSRECSDNSTTNTNHKPPSILPSEYIYISREIESWNNFPSTYSTSVHNAILGIGIAKENDMDNWIISNSPRYGIVIDTSMQCHIFLLFSLCFKSILREGSVLKNALMWLESQVSILYGVNGKLFVLDFVKKCILAGASFLLLFPLGNNEVDDSVASKKEMNNADCIQKRKITMPQVVAAVAALHERALLERKIKGFWFSHPTNSYQLKAEHCYLYDKANEERKNRVDYRPIIEYDWVHRQHSYQQGTQKEKTVEELLAEERDYKRRRMSYRGKKRNQAPLQVMRDLIGEYMEEIKLATGVKSPVRVSEDSLMPPPKLSSSHAIPMETNNSRKVSDDSPAVHVATSRDYEQRKQRHHRSHHNGGDRASTSPERQRSRNGSHEHRVHHKKQEL